MLTFLGQAGMTSYPELGESGHLSHFGPCRENPMGDDERELTFRGDLEDLILSSTDGNRDKVTRLARRAGIKDPPEKADVESSANEIVFVRARSPKVLVSLLTNLPKVCNLEGTDELNRLIRECKALFPAMNQGADDTSPRSSDSATEVEGLYNEAADLVLQAQDLRLKFQPLLSSQELMPTDLTELSNLLSRTASSIAELLHSYSADSKLSIPARRILALLNRIEDEIFGCLDSLWYYTQIHSIFDASRRTGTGIGVSEPA
jgi:hypothetical protein